jgi:ADP-heptose:LPS heptosyltransferase
MAEPSGKQRLAELRPRRVVILRALQLGDMLCAVPALRALRAALPQAELVLAGLPWARDFAARYRMYLDGFRELPGYPGLPERPPEPARVAPWLVERQAERFDLAVQMHGSGRVTNPLVALLGARRTAGFFVPGDYCPDPELFLPYPDYGLEVHRLLRLAEFLGARRQGDELEFPILPADFEELRRLEGVESLEPGGYVCVHPGASVAPRRWPPERFAEVARALATWGLRLVFTGTEQEIALCRAVGQTLAGPYLNSAGRTSLGGLAALLRGARLLVCNDTGVSHLAAALVVPSVVISTGRNPDRWAPLDGRRHRVLCRDGGVPPDEVLRHAGELLGAGPKPVRRAPAFQATWGEAEACAPCAS